MSTATAEPDLYDLHRDPHTEAWLDSLHITWTYEPALALERIDTSKSLANQARLEALDPEVVARYTADLDRGDTFPPVLAVAGAKKSSKVVLVGGNHRHAAHEQLRRPTIPAYLLADVAEPMALRLAYEDNRRHGLPPSEAERIRQAIHLIDQGWEQQAAAACVGVPAPKISMARSRIKATRRAATVGINVRAFEGLGGGQQYSLGQLRSDPIFKRTTQLVLDAHLTDAATRKLVGELREASSDKDADAILDVRTEELRPQVHASAGGKIRSNVTARTRMLAALSSVRAVDPIEAVTSCTTLDQVRHLDETITAVIERLMKASNALQRARR